MRVSVKPLQSGCLGHQMKKTRDPELITSTKNMCRINIQPQQDPKRKNNQRAHWQLHLGCKQKLPVIRTTCRMSYLVLSWYSINFRSIVFPVEIGGSIWNVWELAIGESTGSERRKIKHARGWYGRDCRKGIWRGLHAVRVVGERLLRRK